MSHDLRQPGLRFMDLKFQLHRLFSSLNERQERAGISTRFRAPDLATPPTLRALLTADENARLDEALQGRRGPTALRLARAAVVRASGLSSHEALQFLRLQLRGLDSESRFHAAG